MIESGTESGAWKSLADGDITKGITLAVDFDTTGRHEARFADLVANLQTSVSVWETVPPAAGSSAAGSGAGYVDHWTTPIEQSRPQVNAVFGFCGGAVYAAKLSERISEWQPTQPLLVLFDPELSTSQTLIWQFHKVIGFLSSVISPELVAQAREMGQRAYDEIGEVRALQDELIRLMREFGEPALVSAGLDETRREELYAVFNSFLSYLAAASEIDPLAEWRYATAYSSTSPLSGLNAMRSAGLEITVGREIPVDVDHATMLADKDLALAVTDLLDS
ncbi:hypothetical protein [Streptomyces sp. 6N223]|uniref:hypothetical protein n=1 Tax=Streptomyces sp. 6N223 TaxID=3457412 RepID=UPI003FD08F19